MFCYVVAGHLKHHGVCEELLKLLVGSMGHAAAKLEESLKLLIGSAGHAPTKLEEKG